MAGPRDAYRRLQARRTTVLGLLAVVLIARGVVLSLSRAVGDVVPTVVALLGLLSLVAGIATGSRLVFDNFRLAQRQSTDDGDEDDDEWPRRT